jgi:hypothetical protein
MNKRSFFCDIQLYQKTFRIFEDGTKGMDWKDLGCILAHVQPHKTHKGSAYDVTVPRDPRVFSTDKILYKSEDHFMMHAPRPMKSDRLRLRIFSWSPPK